MSNISETETAEQLITNYSDVGQHTEKNYQRRKIFYTSQPSKNTEVFVSPEQRITIMERVRTFSRDGLKITNCIFRREQVEICYLFDGSSVQNKDELRQQLADHLNINSQLIKMTKLRANPIYRETSLRPGETVNINPEGSGKIGAFVEVEGKGNHAVMSGHGKNPMDEVRCPNGHLVGVVDVALHPRLQPTGQDSYYGYRDVALAKLDQQNGYIAQVSCAVHGQLRLVEQPVEAVEGMEVRCFAANGNRGIVDSTAYIRHDEALEIDWRLISVKDDVGEPIHEEGESGILIVEDAPEGGRVKAVGMLVAIDELPLDDEEETIRRTSLAVPLTTSFKALQNDPYCNGGVIKFLH